MEPARPVFVVEDDDAVREAVCSVLEDAGFQPAGFPNGAEALAHLERGVSPCLVLLDLMMPVMDGWTFLEQVREGARLDGTAIVAMTAVPDRCPVGVPCIAKPFTDEDILVVASEHCSCTAPSPDAPPRPRTGRALPRRRAYTA